MPSTIKIIGEPMNWDIFWQSFHSFVLWDLEWFDGSAWRSVKSDLTIQKSYPEPHRCKFKLIFNASQKGDYRLTFGVKKILKDYFERLDESQVELHFGEKFFIIFDWSDCRNISELKFSHGIKDEYFWFRIERDKVPKGIIIEIDPTTVGQSDHITATQYPHQRKCFYANGLFWVFYYDGTYMMAYYSSDGTTWNSCPQNPIRGIVYGYSFSVWFDGTYLHYAYAYSTSIYYRRGTPNADGSITWSADEQTVSTTYNKANFPFVSVDSSGYVWIAYRDQTGTSYYPYVIKSGNNNGTWGTTPSGFPYQLSTTTSVAWRVGIIPLTATKMLVVYIYNANPIRVKAWNGSSWGAEANTSGVENVKYGYTWSACAEGDDVHFLIADTVLDLIYCKYTYSTNSFGGYYTVQDNVTTSSTPVLSIDPTTSNLYCFWAGSPTADHIYYKKRVGTTWDADPTDWITDPTLTANDRLVCYYKFYSNQMAIIYMKNSSAPYDIRHEYLGAPPPPAVGYQYSNGLVSIQGAG